MTTKHKYHNIKLTEDELAFYANYLNRKLNDPVIILDIYRIIDSLSLFIYNEPYALRAKKEIQEAMFELDLKDLINA